MKSSQQNTIRYEISCNWCVFAGVEESEGRHNLISIIEKEEATFSHEYGQYLDHFLSSDADMEDKLQEPVVSMNKEDLAYEGKGKNLEDEGQH
jgi:hypothetical protein